MKGFFLKIFSAVLFLYPVKRLKKWLKRMEYGYISKPEYISAWDNFRIKKRYIGVIKNIESF
jgi:uncharacterized protein YbgA (DUF1722 family)